MNGPVDDGGFSTSNSPVDSTSQCLTSCRTIKENAIFHLCGEYADL